MNIKANNAGLDSEIDKFFRKKTPENPNDPALIAILNNPVALAQIDPDNNTDWCWTIWDADKEDAESYYEVDAYYQAFVSNQNADFRLLGTKDDGTMGDGIALLVKYYNALEVTRTRNAGIGKKMIIEDHDLAEKVKEFQQGIYRDILYPEMKRYKDIGGVPRYVVDPLNPAWNFRAPK
jgi:hypothetical protein